MIAEQMLTIAVTARPDRSEFAELRGQLHEVGDALDRAVESLSEVLPPVSEVANEASTRLIYADDPFEDDPTGDSARRIDEIVQGVRAALPAAKSDGG